MEGRWALEIDPRMPMVLVKLPTAKKKLKQLKSSVGVITSNEGPGTLFEHQAY